MGLKASFLESKSGLSGTYTVHVNGIPKWNIRVPTAMGFVDFWRSIEVNAVGFLVRADEESVDIVLQQKLVPISAMSVLGFIGALQTIKSRPRNVDASG